jgi:hypothetical protein
MCAGFGANNDSARVNCCKDFDFENTTGAESFTSSHTFQVSVLSSQISEASPVRTFGCMEKISSLARSSRGKKGPSRVVHRLGAT